MRDRMSRKSIYEDELIWTTLNFFEIELFRGLWHIANDIGVAVYSVREFKRSLFYYCDDVSNKQIMEGFRKIVKIRRVVVYKDTHGSDKILFWVVNFNKNQLPPKPTPAKLPRPDGSFNYNKDFVPSSALKGFDYKGQDALINTAGIINVYDVKPEEQKSKKTEKNKKTVPAKKERTPTIVQEYMMFFKEFIGIPADHKEWDRQYYKVYIRDANRIIKYLQDAAVKTGNNVLDIAKQATREIVSDLQHKGLSWSLQGAVRKALPDWSVKYIRRQEQSLKYTAARKKEEADRKILIDESADPKQKEAVRNLMEKFMKRKPLSKGNDNDKK